SGLRDLPAVHSSLEDRIQEAQRQSVEEPLLGDLAERGEHLVPPSEHEQRVARLRQGSPLAGPRAATPCDRQRVGEKRQGVVVAVTPERDVREVEESVVLLLVEVVLA